MNAKKAASRGIAADTSRLLDSREGGEGDFKRSPDAVKPEDLIALANGVGGTILVGVDEAPTEKGLQHGKVVGCDVGDKALQAIVNAASTCRPAVEVHLSVENARSTPFISIDVPEVAHKPYCTAAGTYKNRADGQNIALEPPLLKAMILHAEADEFIA